MTLIRQLHSQSNETFSQLTYSPSVTELTFVKRRMSQLMILPPGKSFQDVGRTRLSPKTRTLKQPLAENLFTACNFFSSEECKSWINYCNTIGFAEIKANATYETARRYHGRIQVRAADAAASIFQRLLPFLPADLDGCAPVGCNPDIRLYRYTPGQSFGKHVDGSTEDHEGRGVTKFTVLIYLTGVNENNAFREDPSAAQSLLRGGETIFYALSTSILKGKSAKQPTEKLLLSVRPQTGMLLAHAHGDRCLTHEGAPVISGIKYVLRTDVVYG